LRSIFFFLHIAPEAVIRVYFTIWEIKKLTISVFAVRHNKILNDNIFIVFEYYSVKFIKKNLNVLNEEDEIFIEKVIFVWYNEYA